MLPLFKLIRWANLLIVVLTLYTVRWAILCPALQLEGIQAFFDELAFSLVVLATVLIAAAGYIVNDIVDLPIDLINKPNKVIIQKKISTAKAWWIYGLFNSLAIALGLYLGQLLILFIFVSTIVGLALYAYYWKAQVLIGNIAVAFFCALVVVEVWILDWNKLTVPFSSSFPLQVLLGYTLFAFLTTVLREIVKDIEDIEGDRQQNCQTAPVVWGIKSSRFLALGIGIGLLLSLCFALYSWQFFLSQLWLSSFVILLILPLLVILILLNLAQFTPQFSQLSKLIKIYMALGLFWLGLLYSYFMDIIKIGLS